MAVESPVEEAAPGTACAVFLDGSDSGSLDFGVVCKSEVGVGSEHQDWLTIDDDLSILIALDLTEVGIDPCGLSLLGLGIAR